MFNTRIGDEQVLGRTYFKILPDSNVLQSMNNATPDVKEINLLVFKNVAPITVTNFKSGRDGSILTVIGDGFTTIANNASIKTSTGANKLLAILAYIFISYQNIWYEK